jgi:antitoxin (DNA-binding transcriptional repressor) of toxin-antitoxin stability system
MRQVNVHAAKTHLSRLIADACAGEEIVIARDDKPMVRLVPVAPQPRVRRFGSMAGQARTDDNFLQPLPEAELAAWE